MSYPINYPTPQGANIQIFKGGNTNDTTHRNIRTWVKPQGCSFVWFTLIGAGGRGGTTQAGTAGGGGSGAVTNCLMPAFLIPDQLQVYVGSGAPTTPLKSEIYYQQKDGTGYTLLTANPGINGDSAGGGAGGTASTSNFFSAAGFFQSVAGQSGGTGNISASSTTFLSGGPGIISNVTANYGYSTVSLNPGFFQTQPIIVGVANGGNNASTNKYTAGIGCGGGSANDNVGGVATNGGDGMVVIISW